jgi:hypothetical protein
VLRIIQKLFSFLWAVVQYVVGVAGMLVWFIIHIAEFVIGVVAILFVVGFIKGCIGN